MQINTKTETQSFKDKFQICVSKGSIKMYEISKDCKNSWGKRQYNMATHRMEKMLTKQ